MKPPGPGEQGSNGAAALGRHSPSQATFLVLASLGLWLAALAVAIGPVPLQIALCLRLQVRLPSALAPLVLLAPWLAYSCWFLVFVLFAPLAGVLTYRLRRGVLGWIWGAFMVLTPLLLLACLVTSLFAAQRATLQGLYTSQSNCDHLLYFGQLPCPLAITETRGGDRPVTERLVVEPTGEWWISLEAAPEAEKRIHGGKLTRDQLETLARHLDLQRVDRLVELDQRAAGLFDVQEPKLTRATDSLKVEYGSARTFQRGVTRATLRDGPLSVIHQRAEAWLRFVALVLVVDDLVGRKPPRGVAWRSARSRGCWRTRSCAVLRLSPIWPPSGLVCFGLAAWRS
jgi:hypothetical protein